MNYFQNSNINNFYPLMQKSTVNKLVQPQLVCVDQSNMNVTATAYNTIKNSTSQKFQRGSRQYIIKYRNSNVSTISTSQSPQKKNKDQIKQELNSHLSNPYQKENKLLAEISIKATKIVSKVVSPTSSVSTQSSNKNDLPATDKDDDSPLRLNNKDQIQKIIQFQNDSIAQKASEKVFPNVCKINQKLTLKLCNQQLNDSESPSRSQSNESKNVQFFTSNQNSSQANQEEEQEKHRKINLIRNSKTYLKKVNNQNQDPKTVNRVNYQTAQENSSEINQQITSVTTRTRDASAPPLNEIQQNNKLLENDQNNLKNTSIQIQQFSQKRHSILRLSDPQAIVYTLQNDISLGNRSQKNDQDYNKQQKIQQSERQVHLTTFSQIQFNETIKKQITQKQTKKNSSFLCTKRKKFKKSKNPTNLLENPLSIKIQQNTQFVSNQEDKFEQDDQDFQTLADQLENQQLHMKIVGNEYLLDDDNAYSEEYLEDDEDINKEIIQPQLKDNKKTKINNSVILPSLEDQLEQTFKSKELDSLNLTAKSVCIYDVEKNKPILSLKGKKSREVASLTKIMTCYIICQAIQKKKIKQADQIKVSRAAASMIGTSAYLRSGDQLSVWDLLHGLMLPSGNDAAFALAEYMGRILFFEDSDYKEQLQHNPSSFENCKAKDAIKCFLKEMNRVAKDLKLTSTKYSNPHGLVNKTNRSSAVDICKLSAHCLTKSQLFRQIVKTKQYTCQIKNKQGSVRIANWENTNKCLLRYNTVCDGVKTGVTCTAGPCLTTSWRVKDRHFIITILKCDSLELRYSESQRVFVWICDKLGIDLTEEEKMPYEKVKLLYKRNSVESLHSMKESSSNNSLSFKQNSNLIIKKSDSLIENLKLIQQYHPEQENNKSKPLFNSSKNQ